MKTRLFALILGFVLTWCGGVAVPSPSVDSSLPAGPAISSPAVSSSGEPDSVPNPEHSHFDSPVIGVPFPKVELLYPEDCYDFPIALIHYVGDEAFDAWVNSLEPVDQHIFNFMEYFDMDPEQYRVLADSHPDHDVDAVLALMP